MQDEKKTPRKQLGTLKTEDGDSSKLGSLKSPVRVAQGEGQAEASTSGRGTISGRGSSQGGRGGGRKVKFVPKVPARRKAAQAAAAGDAPSSSNAEENDAFKDLIKAAKSEASWAKGGRGRGRGRGDGGRHHYQTVFGGGGSQQAFAQASGSGGGGGGRGGQSKPGARGAQTGSSTGGAGPKQDMTPGELELLQSEGRKQQEAEVTLNYEQYYPTLLPIRQPGMEETDEEAHARDDRPPDLSQHQEGITNVAADLGFLDLEADPERLLLMQLPSLLPIPASLSLQNRSHAQQMKHVSQPQAASLNQLPSGKIGKLLVFDDGAVKLQMGDVLLDVTAGTPCHFRQEVAAVNAKDAHFIFLGDVAQRVVCSPNIEQLISEEPIPDWPRAPQPPPSTSKQLEKSRMPAPAGLEDAIKDEEMMDAETQVKDEEELEDRSSPDEGLVMNRNAALMDEDESE